MLCEPLQGPSHPVWYPSVPESAREGGWIIASCEAELTPALPVPLSATDRERYINMNKVCAMLFYQNEGGFLYLGVKYCKSEKR